MVAHSARRGRLAICVGGRVGLALARPGVCAVYVHGGRYGGRIRRRRHEGDRPEFARGGRLVMLRVGRDLLAQCGPHVAGIDMACTAEVVKERKVDEYYPILGSFHIPLGYCQKRPILHCSVIAQA